MKLIYLFLMIFSTSVLFAQDHSEYDIPDDFEENSSIMILSQLTDKEADDISRFLQKNHIEVEKKVSSFRYQSSDIKQTWNIYVPLLDVVEAVTLLDDADLPEREPSQLFEEFLKRQRQFGKEFAQENERLAKMIEGFDGVINAEVLIQEKKDANGQKKVTAVIYVKHNGILDDVHGKMAKEIKALILEEIPELTEKNITFVPDKQAKKSYKLPNIEY